MNQWRWGEGSKKGQFSPSPEPEPRFDWSYKNDEGEWVNPRTGETLTQGEAVNRNRNLERAKIFKAYLGMEGVDLTYQDLQEKFEGIPTEEIRGKLKFLDEETGNTEYEDPSPRAQSIIDEIKDMAVAQFVPQPERFIETP